MRYRLEEYRSAGSGSAYLNCSLEDSLLREQRYLLNESGYLQTGRAFRIEAINDNLIPELPEVYEEILEEKQNYVLTAFYHSGSLPSYRLYEKSGYLEKLVFTSYLLPAARSILKKLYPSVHSRRKEMLAV